MRLVTVLAVMLSFITSPLALANGQDRALSNSIRATAGARRAEVARLSEDVRNARRRIHDLQRELDANPHDHAVVLQWKSIAVLGASITTVVVGLGWSQIMRQPNVSPFMFTAMGALTMILSTIVSMRQGGVVSATNETVRELRRKLADAEAELSVTQSRLRLISQEIN